MQSLHLKFNEKDSGKRDFIRKFAVLFKRSGSTY